jgi:hypothetical protein
LCLATRPGEVRIEVTTQTRTIFGDFCFPLFVLGTHDEQSQGILRALLEDSAREYIHGDAGAAYADEAPVAEGPDV